MDLEIVTAFCMMPFALIIAAQGWSYMICVFLCIPLSLMTYYYKVAAQFKTKFFLGWSVITFFFLLGVFEFEVVPYLEILFIENLCLMCSVGVMCLFFFLVKSNSQLASQTTHQSSARTRCEICSFMQPARTLHCDLCGHCVTKRDHHNVWLDACVGLKNQQYFVGGLLFLLVSCIYSSNLTLTTICHPSLVIGMFFMPDDCSDVFADFHISICFVSAIYTLIIALFCLYLLLQQMWLVCHNATYQDWKEGHLSLYSNGLRKNLVDFWIKNQ